MLDAVWSAKNLDPDSEEYQGYLLSTEIRNPALPNSFLTIYKTLFDKMQRFQMDAKAASMPDKLENLRFPWYEKSEYKKKMKKLWRMIRRLIFGDRAGFEDMSGCGFNEFRDLPIPGPAEVISATELADKYYGPGMAEEQQREQERWD